MKEIERMARVNTAEAERILKTSGIEKIWRNAGCRVSLVGSLRMGLLLKHLDIDLHVYSENISIESSFAIAAQMAANPRVREIKCINGLHTNEHCVAWHLTYCAQDNRLWQIDIIHIEAGTQYDGFFEKIADGIKKIMTLEQRNIILRLKYLTPEGADWHGIEYYEAVIADGVSSIPEFKQWITIHRNKPAYYWQPI